MLTRLGPRLWESALHCLFVVNLICNVFIQDQPNYFVGYFVINVQIEYWIEEALAVTSD